MNLWVKKFLPILTATLLVVFLFKTPALAHPGRTASDGCHYCRTRCDYWGVPWNARHCHGGTIPAPPPRVEQTPTPIIIKPIPSPVPLPSLSPEPSLSSSPSPSPSLNPSPLPPLSPSSQQSPEVKGEATQDTSSASTIGTIGSLGLMGALAWGTYKLVKRFT